ncbi:MAG: MarR family transcriptional regulator [Methanosphaera stadtmanae]|nr:MarR family transcriptional regulator [Methanosphaera stadtmanae]
MKLPKQFKEENKQNIFIYHYVEELISNYGEYIKKNYTDENLTRKELPFLIRIRFSDNTTQQELVELFKVSDAYTAKILRKFENLEYITRIEDPTNRRRKIVKLTPKGIKKTDKLIEIINNWETNVTSKITKEESETLKTILFKLLM